MFFGAEMLALAFTQWFTLIIILLMFTAFASVFEGLPQRLSLVAGILRLCEEIGVYAGMLYILYVWRRVDHLGELAQQKDVICLISIVFERLC